MFGSIRGGSRTATTSTLDVAGVLDPPLNCMNELEVKPFNQLGCKSKILYILTVVR